MREIRFRGKDIWGNWRYGDLMKNSIPTASPVIVENFYYDDPDDSMFEVDSATIGQFTGLLDRGGKEIYEGDIVKVDGWRKPALVEWFDANAQFVIDGNMNLGLRNSFLQVIGNVYDSPELLELDNARNQV